MERDTFLDSPAYATFLRRRLGRWRCERICRTIHRRGNELGAGNWQCCGQPRKCDDSRKCIIKGVADYCESNCSFVTHAMLDDRSSASPRQIAPNWNARRSILPVSCRSSCKCFWFQSGCNYSLSHVHETRTLTDACIQSIGCANPPQRFSRAAWIEMASSVAPDLPPLHHSQREILPGGNSASTNPSIAVKAKPATATGRSATCCAISTFSPKTRHWRWRPISSNVPY